MSRGGAPVRTNFRREASRGGPLAPLRSRRGRCGIVDSLPEGTGSRTAGACLVVAFILAVVSLPARADDEDGNSGNDNEPAVTPYRPTVSNPADLSAPGWFEGEAGGLRTLNEDHSSGDSVPWLLKYALDENYGLLISGNGYLSQQLAGAPTQGGFGDLTFAWKQRFPVSDTAAFGIEAGAVAPTASQDLGVGKPQWFLNGIFSTDLGSLHLDVNLAESHGGEEPAGVSLWQSTWAAAASHPLAGKWGAAFELSGTYQQGTATQSQALFALSYNWSRRLVLDCGAAYGLAHAAHDRSLFAGATFLIGRLR
jgi:hypothetical protein